MTTLVNTNLGGFKNKKNALHDELTQIQNLYGKIDTLTIQEFCDFRTSTVPPHEARISPFFTTPPTTNELSAATLDHCRGVATFTTHEHQPPTTLPSPSSEICTTLHTVRRPGRHGRKPRNTKLAIINVYNNHNIDNDTLLKDIQP